MEIVQKQLDNRENKFNVYKCDINIYIYICACVQNVGMLVKKIRAYLNSEKLLYLLILKFK